MLLTAGRLAAAQAAIPAVPGRAAEAAPPPSTNGIFPLSQVHRGLKATAWTVFEGTAPEPMDVEILGVQRGARGPGQDMILARLHGEKPEFSGVVAGMSGSPVYVDGKLLGALSYRIGQFSKEPIAGITPIEQMLEVRDIPASTARPASMASLKPSGFDGQPQVAAMDTPLLMSGFGPEAIQLWKEKMAGTGLEAVSAGGPMGNSGETSFDGGPLLPGSAVSMQLVTGDLEIAATCTVTYIDPHQLLACGHPVLQAGPISLPMTRAEVLLTLASPLNAFKIINTGATVGAFTEDRAAAIRGELGAKAHMIPVSITVANWNNGQSAAGEHTLAHKLEVLDLPSLTPSAMLVSIYQILLETNQSTAESSYHVTGEIALSGQAPIPVNAWSTPGEPTPAPLGAAVGVADAFNRLYANATRLTPVESVHVRVEAIPRDLRTELESVRVVSPSTIHAGDTVVLEATVRPWQQAKSNLRMQFRMPARLEPGNLRLLVGNATSLDRTLDAALPPGQSPDVEGASARLRRLHPADHLFATLLLPETGASVSGQSLDSLPLSMANTLESGRGSAEAALHGESALVVADTAAGGVLTGQQLLTLRVEAGSGLH